MPRIANLVANGENEKIKYYIIKSSKAIFMLGVPMTIGIFCVAEKFIPLFLGSGYDRSIPVLQILSIFCVIMGLSSLMGLSYLVPLCRQKQYTISVLANAVVNIIFDVLFIPTMGAVGAAIATVIAEFTTLLIQLIYTRKEFRYLHIIGSMRNYFISGLIMGVVVLIFQHFFINISIYITVIAGGVIYLIILTLFRDAAFFEFVDRIMNLIFKRVKKSN